MPYFCIGRVTYLLYRTGLLRPHSLSFRLRVGLLIRRQNVNLLFHLLNFPVFLLGTGAHLRVSVTFSPIDLIHIHIVLALVCCSAHVGRVRPRVSAHSIGFMHSNSCILGSSLRWDKLPNVRITHCVVVLSLLGYNNRCMLNVRQFLIRVPLLLGLIKGNSSDTFTFLPCSACRPVLAVEINTV